MTFVAELFQECLEIDGGSFELSTTVSMQTESETTFSRSNFKQTKNLLEFAENLNESFNRDNLIFLMLEIVKSVTKLYLADLIDCQEQLHYKFL